MDPLSSVSSVLGVVSVAAQIAQGIQQLVAFWSDIQDAPAEITALFNHLMLLSKVLGQTRFFGLTDDCEKTTEEALANCENSIKKLLVEIKVSLEELCSPSSRRRKWSAFKVTLKKKKLTSLRESIQEATITVSLIQVTSLHRVTTKGFLHQAHVLELLEANMLRSCHQIISTITGPPDTKNGICKRVQYSEVAETVNDCTVRALPKHGSPEIAEELPRIVTNDSGKPSSHPSSSLVTTSMSAMCMSVDEISEDTNRREVCEHHTETSLVETRSQNDSDAVNKRQLRRPPPYLRKDFNYIFYPPKLLRKLGISHGIQIFGTSTHGWQYSLQPFRAVPDDALIFEFCRDGNLDGIKSLLRRGEASPWDRDSRGRTPLWVAASWLNVEIAKFLLDEHAAPYESNWERHQKDPIDAAIYSPVLDVNRQISVINLLQDHDFYGYDEKHVAGWKTKLLIGYRPGKDIDMSLPERSDSAARVVTHLVPEFQIKDRHVTELLWFAVYFYFDHGVLHNILKNMTTIHDSESVTYSVIHTAIAKQLLERDPISMRMIVNKTENLHRVFRRQTPTSRAIPISLAAQTCLATPTSLAMSQSSTFFAWRNLLKDIGVSIPEFVQREMELTPLIEEGWTQQTLGALFEYDFIPNFGSGIWKCERCGDLESGLATHSRVELRWRRQLRAIRLGQPMNEYGKPLQTGSVLAFNDNVEDNPEEIEVSRLLGTATETPTPKAEQSVEPVRHDAGDHFPPSLPYNFVCPAECHDGDYVARLYENDSMDEPYFPPHDSRRSKFNRLWITNADSDKCPSRKMPGAFQD